MMTYDEINAEWAKDAADFHDNPDIFRHSREQYILHQKYYSLYNQYKNKYYKLEAMLNNYKRDRLEYLVGDMELEEIKKRNWPLQPKRIAKTEAPKYIASDEAVIEFTLKLNEYRTTIDYLEDIIKIISYRHMNIKNMIDYERFQAGN